VQQRLRTVRGILALDQQLPPPQLISQLAANTLQVDGPHLVDREARLLRQHLLLHICTAPGLAQHIHAHARGSQQADRMPPQVGQRMPHAWRHVSHSPLSDDDGRCTAWPEAMRGYYLRTISST
jgi:hypothetical protein